MDSVSNSFTAGEAALGYIYQCRLALWFALTKLRERDDIDIAIESLDDVTFLSNGKPEELLQTKHHLNTKANLTNASSDLWKTLRIWVSHLPLVEEGVQLFLISTNTAASGSAADKLQNGASRDVATAQKILAEVLATSTNSDNAEAYAAFNGLSSDQQLELLGAVTVIDNSPNVVDVRAEIEKELRLVVRKNQLSAFADRLEGWWYARVVSNLAHQDAGFILGKELHSQIDDLRDQFRQDNLPIDFDTVFPDEDVVKAMLGRPFVEQLRLIALADTRIRFAVADYYRAFEQRSRWLREDLILVGDLENYEKRLVEEWERAFERLKQHNELHEERMKASAGRAVFDWAQDANIFIRSQCQQPYIHRGSFQILSDRLRIGWHPDFLARLEHLLSPLGSAQ